MRGQILGYDSYVSVTRLLVPVSLESNQGEYGAAVWCHEALNDRRTLVEQLSH